MSENIRNQLILGSHAHVPIGADESEFKYVYENKMRPFITNLNRYSNIQAVLHYSGILLYWVERNHPEFFMLIEDMVSRKQAEILGGGFYEPSFPIIPLQDRIGQIELMTTYLRTHFGKRPQGCWIPGFDWEQPLVTALCASEMDYTFLSQDQFILAGLNNERLFLPCISEDQGKLIIIFPVSLSVEKELETKSFSYVFTLLNKKLSDSGMAEDDSAGTESKKPADRNIKNAGKKDSVSRDIKAPASAGNCSLDRIICIFPDKISSSPEEAPDTAWNRFFEEITLSGNIIETALPSKIIKKLKVFKKGSFPDSSAQGNGLSPRRFLIENAESSGIYSKMVFTNVLISQLKGDKARKLNAREELWKAQGASLFSAGDGYLRSDLRKTAYRSLLRAEKLSRGNEKVITSLIQHDFDFDGLNEFLFQGSLINCYIQQKGAGIFELDYMPKGWNYLDCGTYSDSSGAGKKSRRIAFADIIIASDTKITPYIKQPVKNTQSQKSKKDSASEDADKYEPSVRKFARESMIDSLCDEDLIFSSDKTRFCYESHYEALAQDKKGKSCFRLAANGSEIFGFIEINKCYSFKKDLLTVYYTLKNTDVNAQKFNFIAEINFSFAGVTDEYIRFYTTDDEGKDAAVDKKLNANNLKMLDVENEAQIIFSSANVFSGYLMPVFRGGYYQATRILPVFSISLNGGESWTNEFSLKFSH